MWWVAWSCSAAVSELSRLLVVGLPSGYEVALLRAVQASLGNVARHARTEAITTALRRGIIRPQ
jgi:signal transduction histidine kinase